MSGGDEENVAPPSFVVETGEFETGLLYRSDININFMVTGGLDSERAWSETTYVWARGMPFAFTWNNLRKI